MDQFYPHERAAAAVELWNDKLSNPDAPFSKYNMTHPALAFNLSDITIKKDRWRKKFNSHGLKWARQHATIVGYETKSFTQAVNNLRHVAYEMHAAFSEGEVEPWHPEPPVAPHGMALSSNCRYFTLGRNIPEELKTTFDRNTDPNGILSSHLSDTVAHCFDSDVAFMNLKNNRYDLRCVKLATRKSDPGTRVLCNTSPKAAVLVFELFSSIIASNFGISLRTDQMSSL
ncbi:hypothetical protein B0H13DRAFT_2328026 [Mycena leptocephala]|nr:hypothetical protein B0H13DRAFT_2328026 [Mycena leptocephala]